QMLAVFFAARNIAGETHALILIRSGGALTINDRKDLVALVVERAGTGERVLVGELRLAAHPALDRTAAGKFLVLADVQQHLAFGEAFTDTLGDLGVVFARAPHRPRRFFNSVRGQQPDRAAFGSTDRHVGRFF